MRLTYQSFGVNQQIYQGSGCAAVIPEILKKEGWKRVLLVAGPSLIKTGAIKQFEKMLMDCGAEYRIFSDIQPNPMARDVEKIGVPMYRDMKADVMLAVGGGSALDSAKGIAIIGESDKTIFDIAGVMGKYPPHEPLGWKTYPVIAVPTTCGTGSEVIRNAVISEENGHKLVPMHDCIIPAYAVCDPDLLATLPQKAAAASAMDALVQAIEGTVSLAANDFARTMGFHAVELIGPAIVKYCYNRAVPEYADKMSKGCVYAGITWNNSFPAQNHGCNHPITELLHISHGEACAVMMPWFIEWNGECCREDFRRIYNLMEPEHCVSKAEFEVSMLVDEFRALNRKLNIIDGKTLADYGCTDEICARMVSGFFSSPFFPRTTTREEMLAAFIDVMNGKYI